MIWAFAGFPHVHLGCVGFTAHGSKQADRGAVRHCQPQPAISRPNPRYLCSTIRPYAEYQNDF